MTGNDLIWHLTEKGRAGACCEIEPVKVRSGVRGRFSERKDICDRMQRMSTEIHV